MRNIFTSFLFFILTTLVHSQSFQKISSGAGYNKQSFVRLGDNSEKLVDNNAWDIAFTAFGFQDAGIFINESSGSSMGQNLPLAELYYALTDDFNAAINLDALKDYKLLNSEISWNYGAFNELRDTLNPFDFGWGEYQPATNRVIGDKVYVLKLRNGEYRKIKIENLTGTTYTIRHAKLDGSNEITKMLNKQTDNFGQKLIFYSFDSNSSLDILPAGGFDLMYCRYISIAKDPNGTIVQQYNVTGVLTGPGVKTAEASGVNPATVKYDDYKDKLSTITDVIGYDWKTLVGTSWSIDLNKVFFVKTPDNKVWKINFIDFEGSATGNAVFEKTDLGTSATSSLTGIQTGIFPNPVSDELFVSLDNTTDNAENIRISVTDLNGNIIHTENDLIQKDLSVIRISSELWPKGMYSVQISNLKNQNYVKKIVKL